MVRPWLLLLVALSSVCTAACGAGSSESSEEDDAAEQSELRSGTPLFTTGEVRARREPKLTAEAIEILPRGTEVALAASALRDRFRQVTLPSGATGWIFRGHLSLSRPSESAADVGDTAGTTFTADGSGYYPANSRMEGGFKDVHGESLNTLQAFLAGDRPFVSVAMDSQAFAYGQKLRIKELEEKYERPIEFRVVDTGGAFQGKARRRIDICVANQRASLDATINGDLTLTLVD